MSQELLYTSAPKGLQPGSSGFCTVAMTRAMPMALMEKLEKLSGYRPLYPPHDPQAALNPVVQAHLRLTLGGKPIHVLSRIGAAGLDYTERTNKFAHHLVLDGGELPRGGPAWLLSQPGLMETAWDGQVRALPASRALPRGEAPVGVCEAWQRLTGDAGWGGILAEALHQDPTRLCYLIYDPGSDPLPLLVEAFALLPPERRWEATFSTYFMDDLPPGIGCACRCVLRDSAEAKKAGRLPNALVLTLDRSAGQAPGAPLVHQARTGQSVADKAALARTEPASTEPVKLFEEDLPEISTENLAKFEDRAKPRRPHSGAEPNRREPRPDRQVSAGVPPVKGLVADQVVPSPRFAPPTPAPPAEPRSGPWLPVFLMGTAAGLLLAMALGALAVSRGLLQLGNKGKTDEIAANANRPSRDANPVPERDALSAKEMENVRQLLADNHVQAARAAFNNLKDKDPAAAGWPEIKELGKRLLAEEKYGLGQDQLRRQRQELFEKVLLVAQENASEKRLGLVEKLAQLPEERAKVQKLQALAVALKDPRKEQEERDRDFRTRLERLEKKLDQLESVPPTDPGKAAAEIEKDLENLKKDLKGAGPDQMAKLALLSPRVETIKKALASEAPKPRNVDDYLTLPHWSKEKLETELEPFQGNLDLDTKKAYRLHLRGLPNKLEGSLKIRIDDSKAGVLQVLRKSVGAEDQLALWKLQGNRLTFRWEGNYTGDDQGKRICEEARELLQDTVLKITSPDEGKEFNFALRIPRTVATEPIKLASSEKLRFKYKLDWGNTGKPKPSLFLQGLGLKLKEKEVSVTAKSLDPPSAKLEEKPDSRQFGPGRLDRIRAELEPNGELAIVLETESEMKVNELYLRSLDVFMEVNGLRVEVYKVKPKENPKK